MRTFKLFALLLCLSYGAKAQISDPAPYCQPFDIGGTSPMNTYNMLGSVKVNGTSQSLGPEGALGAPIPMRYYNTTVFPNLTIGGNTTIEILSYSVDDSEPSYFAVYIDINHNNTFDANEVFMQNNNTINALLNTFASPDQTITKTFQIPATALTGQTRMRVKKYGNTANLYGPYSATYTVPPCTEGSNTFNYGMSYDFNVNIVPGGPVLVPDAAFTANPTTAIVNNTLVNLTDQSTNTPTSWNWTITPNTFAFQSGTSATSQNPIVKFNAIGTYTVKLKVSNAGGADSATSTNYITVQNPGPAVPIADFTANNTTPVATISTVTFTDLSANLPISRIWSITPNTFSFQNGTSATATNPQVVFNAAGDYSVTLTATNAVGSGTITKTNYIHATAPQMAPVADFMADAIIANTNTTVVSFTDLSTNGPNTNYWSFSPQSIIYQNNGNATTTNPKVIFTAPGDYTVKLRVTNTAGKDSITKNAYIHVTGGATGIAENETAANVVQVYPNPTHDYLNIKINASEKIRNVIIMDAEGRQVTSFSQIKSNRVDIRSLPNGTYFLNLETEKGISKRNIRFTKL